MPLKDVNHEDTKRGKHNGPWKGNEAWKLESKQKSVTGHVLASPCHPVSTRQGGRALLCTACRFLGWRWCSQAPNVKSPDRQDKTHGGAPACGPPHCMSARCQAARGPPSATRVQEARGHKSASVKGTAEGSGNAQEGGNSLLLTQCTQVCVAQFNNVRAHCQGLHATACHQQALWAKESCDQSPEGGRRHRNPPKEMKVNSERKILIKETMSS